MPGGDTVVLRAWPEHNMQTGAARQGFTAQQRVSLWLSREQVEQDSGRLFVFPVNICLWFLSCAISPVFICVIHLASSHEKCT